jgi:flagellar basal-body rod modification protein FlgD
MNLGSNDRGLVGFSWTDIPDEIKENKTRLTIQAYAGNGQASDGISTSVYNKVIAASAPKDSEDIILETKDYGEISANDAIKIKAADIIRKPERSLSDILNELEGNEN